MNAPTSIASTDHWNAVYRARAADAVSWFRPHLDVSLRLLQAYGMDAGSSVIDVGAGASTLVDDLLDYRGEGGTMGKNAGDDFREGKMTLPVILAHARDPPGEREIISGTLGRADASDTALAQIVGIFDRHQTLDRTIDKAQGHVRRAREALRPLPASEARALLSDIAEFYVSRAY